MVIMMIMIIMMIMMNVEYLINYIYINVLAHDS